MVSVDHHSYSTMSRNGNNEHGDFTLYPEPPHGVFSSAPVDMTISRDAYIFPTSMAFEHSPSYAENTHYGYGGLSSPGRYEDAELQVPPSNVSSASAPSASSSAIGSPQSHHGQLGPVPDWSHQGFGLTPNIVPNDFYNMTGTEYTSFVNPGMEEFAFEFVNAKPHGFVDPSLIHPEISRPVAMSGFDATFQHAHFNHSPSVSSSPQSFARNGSKSPYLPDGFQQVQQMYSPFQPPMDGRRASVHSFPSTTYSDANAYSGDETKEQKQKCPHPDCGKTFKDLKAHMLTHQNERPEKCPIQTCDYHIKGFARKYDKNRHTLTHYKGTMVCGFCPGSGSAAEKSFNRADVFKRHLTAVHGVEQTPPNSRKKSAGSNTGKKLTGYASDATGKCSTCTKTFSNAQDFYEHLDDCVLRIVQQEDPTEAVNARLLAEVEHDRDVVQTLQRNNLPAQTQETNTMVDDDDDDEDDEDEMDEDDEDDEQESIEKSMSPGTKRKTIAANSAGKSRGMTHSRGGVALRVKAKGRKNRKDKPRSWGYDKELVTLKKRVICAFDGPRRLAKDDMMLSTEQEVRIKLNDGKSYTTDLDIYTLARAEGFHSATDEEKGLWVNDDPTETQYRLMQEHALKQESDAQDTLDL